MMFSDWSYKMPIVSLVATFAILAPRLGAFQLIANKKLKTAHSARAIRFPTMSQAPSDPYRVANIAGKGIGLISSRRISVGEMIISEPPLITLPSGLQEEEGKKAISRLTPVQQEQFYQLHDCKSNADDSSSKTAIGIFQTNALPVGKKSSLGGIFPKIARINHSCRPNLNFYFNEDTQLAEMYAARPIDEGEELTFTYNGSPLQKRSQRQLYLMGGFRFKCTCDVCSLPADEGAVSDTRRERLRYLSVQTANLLSKLDQMDREDSRSDDTDTDTDTDISEGGNTDSEREERERDALVSEAVALVEERLRLLAEEQLDIPMQLMLCEYDAYLACTKSKSGAKSKEAKQWLERTLSHVVQAQGAGSSTAIRLRGLLPASET